MKYFIFIIILIVFGIPAYSQTNKELKLIDKRSTKYLKNVVQITAESNLNKINNSGHGVIIGHDNKYLFIVTAYHVLNPNNILYLNHDSINIYISLYGGNQPIQGEILNYSTAGGNGDYIEDIALLKASYPSGFSMEKQCLSPSSISTLYSEVYFLKDWAKPVEKVIKIKDQWGQITSENGNHWMANYSSPITGYSGGAVFNEYGIIGMLQEAATSRVKILKISKIIEWIDKQNLLDHNSNLPIQINLESIELYDKLPNAARVSLFSGAAVSLGIGFFFSENSKTDYKTYVEHRINSDLIYSDISREDLFKRAERRKNWANVFWGSAGALIIAAISDQSKIFGKDIFYKKNEVDHASRIELKPSVLNICENYCPISSNALGLQLTFGF